VTDRSPPPDKRQLTGETGVAPVYGPARYWYVTVVLMLAYVLSYVDRSILTLLVEPIRRDMGFSDVQISLLHGLAFALFYSLMGFPIGRIADRRHRVGIIAIGIAVWSLMTAVCGIARNFGQFFLARVGVGVGEAALNPAAYSILTDYFPRDKLSRGISTYVMGTYMGFGISYLVGAWVLRAVEDLPDFEIPMLGTFHSWQMAFFLVAAPGILLLLLLTTVREPYRRDRLYRHGAGKRSLPVREFFAFVYTNRRTFLCHAGGYGCLGVLVNGMALWTPAFLTRTYGWEMVDAGMAYGLILLVFGAVGIYCGGWLADHLEARGRRAATFRTAAVCASCAVLPATLFPLANTPSAALLLMAPMVFLSAAPWGIAVASIQQITPNELRGQVSALMYLFPVNLIGIGLGPTAVALITERGFGNPADLKYSMAIVGCVASVMAAAILSAGIRPFRDSLRRAEHWKV